MKKGPAINLLKANIVIFLVFTASLILFLAHREEIDLRTMWLALVVVSVTGVLLLILSQVICRNENTLRRIEQKLREEENFFRKFIDNAHIPIAIVHVNGTVESVNEKFEQLYGYTLADIPTIDQWFSKAYPDEKLIKEISLAWDSKLKDAMVAGTAPTFKERTVTCKDGSIRDVVFAYTLVNDRVIITFNDNTERNRLIRKEQDLLQKQEKNKKMEALGLMAGGVAHDLNNILAGVVNYPELLLLDLPPDSKFKKTLEKIRDAGMRAAAVVSDLLTIARGAASNRVICNLNDLIDEHLHSPEHCKLMGPLKNVTFIKQFQPDLSNIACSPVHIKKCLMNLLTNAVEAIDQDGQVIISTRNQWVDKGTSDMLQVQEGEYTVLNVKDTGSGIDPADIEHVFEPFYTKKVQGRSGTGLGLSVVWNTVHDHGGGILLESDKNGTTFELFLPASPDALPLAEKTTLPEEFKGNGERILVVDDEQQLRDIASQMLLSLGYKVDAVGSGNEAIEYLRENKVNLVILDMLLGPGMNGFETYKQIVRIHPGQKALIASGFSQSEDVEKTRRLGAGGFIKKPYTMNQLGKAVQEELTRSV